MRLWNMAQNGPKRSQMSKNCKKKGSKSDKNTPKKSGNYQNQTKSPLCVVLGLLRVIPGCFGWYEMPLGDYG